MMDVAIYLAVFIAGGSFGAICMCLLCMGRDN